MKNRKLFPNQTIECPNFCDPSCPFNCYSYPDYYYYLSPPPPPPPTSLSDQNHYISPYVIIFVSVLAGLFLVAGYYVVIVNSVFGFCARNDWRRPQSDAVSDEEFLEENRADHPIWFIAAVGLQQSIINSITVCKYKKSEGLIEGTECSVCLNEFQEEETLRLLPKCNHAFHISCIDTWLRTHVNCPLCRAHIVFDDAPTTAPADRNSDRIDAVVDNRIENFETGDSENRGAIVLIPEALVAGDCIDGRRQQVVSEDIPKIKRCVSMDSSSSAEHLGNSFSSIRTKQDGSSIADQHLHISPVPMKRSLSCGGRFFSSKRYRNINPVLPL